MTGRARLGVSIIACNEAELLPRCLESVAFADEIVVVVDAKSSDATESLARDAGARVVVNPYLGNVEQKNFALDQMDCDWVLALDADEAVTPALAAEIEAFVAGGSGKADAAEVNRITFHLGRWIRHGDFFPDWQLRLFRLGEGRWAGVNPHGRVTVSGGVHRLAGELEHRSYRDLADQVARIQDFSDTQALIHSRAGRRGTVRDMILRPPARFARAYLLKQGFRDGVPGFVIAAATAFHVFLKYAKQWEMDHVADAREGSGPGLSGDRALFVPGRLCLFGEHSDWAGGYRSTHAQIAPGMCLVTGTDQGLRAEAEASDALVVSSRLPSGEEIGPARIGSTKSELAAAARGADFFSYAAGAAHELVERFEVGGLTLRIEADLPVRKGLSSSAAVGVLVARAYSQVYGLGLGPRDEMDLAYHGERRTGSECGRMDQVCAYGRRVTFLRFDGDDLDVEILEPERTLHLLIVDLRSGKDTRRILADLNSCFPDVAGELAVGVRHALGPANAALVGQARTALEDGDAAALGACMRAAQDLFDERIAPASPELAAPRLHALLDHPAVARLGHGAKGVGSQGDGSAQIVARSAEDREELARILEAELAVRCLPLTISPG